MRTKKTLLSVSCYVSLLFPVTTLAAGPTIIERPQGGTIAGVFVGIANYLLAFSSALAVLFIVIGGVRYITSGGNEQSLEGAKKTLTYAIIGLVVVILSLFIVNFIQGDLLSKIFGGGVNTYTP